MFVYSRCLFDLVVDLDLLKCEIILADLLEIPSICKLSWKSSTFFASVTLFLLVGGFSVVLLKIFLTEVEDMVILQTILEVRYTTAEFATWVSLCLDDIFFEGFP